MIDPSKILSSCNTLIVGNLKTKVIGNLTKDSVSSSQVSLITPFLDKIVKVFEGDSSSASAAASPSDGEDSSDRSGVDSDDLATRAVSTSSDRQSKVIISKITTVNVGKINKERQDSSEVEKDSHEVFNSEASVSTPEPIFSEAKFTKPVDIQDSNYSLKEDYPLSYGFIDPVMNWFKINKKRKHAEFVHASGTQIKIDKDGNVTIFTKGSIKQVVTKDYSLEVGGSMDMLIKGSLYTHTSKDYVEMIDGNHNTTIGGVRKESASAIHHN